MTATARFGIGRVRGSLRRRAVSCRAGARRLRGRAPAVHVRHFVPWDSPLKIAKPPPALALDALPPSMK